MSTRSEEKLSKGAQSASNRNASHSLGISLQGPVYSMMSDRTLFACARCSRCGRVSTDTHVSAILWDHH